MTADKDDEVVLLDEDGTPIGSASKASVHGAGTPFHLAFSCHLIDDSGRVLVTRRSLAKRTWPGVWSNSFCGHPRPSETLIRALHRRADYELGLDVTDVELAVPLFSYRARDASGVVENELCPVYLARAIGTPAPRPDEVMDFAWADPAALGETIRNAPWAFSPWLVSQARLMPVFGGRLPDPEIDRPESEADMAVLVDTALSFVEASAR